MQIDPDDKMSKHLELLLALGDLAAARTQLEAALALPAETAADRDEQARAQALLDSL